MAKRRRVDYPHLPQVPDYLDYDLDIVFVGINPGVTSSTSGHHYGHASNLFWRCLRDSGNSSLFAVIENTQGVAARSG